jgi:hypothetical protein
VSSTSDDKLTRQTRFLRRLGNPYAKEQIEFRNVDPEAAAIRYSENPYATHYYSRAADTDVAAGSARGTPKREFRRECTKIFRRYMPEGSGVTLRGHHQRFIDRNEVRPAHERTRILQALRRYDISDIGATSVSNRERDDFTEQKLLVLEREALGR